MSGAVEGNRFKLSFPNSPKHDFFEVFHHGHYFFPINPTALLLLNLDDLSNLFTSHTRTERVAFLTTTLLLSLTFGHLKRCSGKSVGHEWHHKMVVFLLLLLLQKRSLFLQRKLHLIPQVGVSPTFTLRSTLPKSTGAFLFHTALASP